MLNFHNKTKHLVFCLKEWSGNNYMEENEVLNYQNNIGVVLTQGKQQQMLYITGYLTTVCFVFIINWLVNLGREQLISKIYSKN